MTFGATIDAIVLPAPIVKPFFIAIDLVVYITIFLVELLFDMTSFAISSAAPLLPASTPDPPIKPETTPVPAAQARPSAVMF